MGDQRCFYLFTQGCKINQHETQALREAWQERGWREVESASQADLILINSCAVTHKAVRDLRRAARGLHRESPGAEIAVTGCAVPGFGEELCELPGVRRLVAQRDKQQLLAWPEGEADAERGCGAAEKKWPLAISRFPRARPALKVQDGCSAGCTYCYVPLSRGPSRSRPPEEVLREALDLARHGYRELVLSGINLGQYSAAGEGVRDFWDLLFWLETRLIAAGRDGIRLRMSSLDPSLLGDKGLRTLAASELLCPHLHLSLQSASPGILSDMGRDRYRPADVSAFIRELTRIWPDFALGADFLLGFPGETERDFAETLDFARKMPFTYGHVFTFSPRPGTRAAGFSGSVSPGVKKRRSEELRGVLQDKQQAFACRMAELDRLWMVLEQRDPPAGRCEYYSLCYLGGDPGPGREGELIAVQPLEPREGGILVREEKAL
ncbi:MAG: MiaB/RimO family radical SAM methylthiotransferase [Desulfohalobiaceae bacterium]|nr:MiaB/RimO family radical SAM methylthiotransferase [Desulfohalobiaceae bacterium]